jgi:signal transduction histidine kinase
MSPRVSSRVAWGLAGLSFAAAGLWAILAIAWRRQLGGSNITSDLGPALIAVVYPAVGVLIATRRRENPIGWLMIAIGLSLGITSAAHAYTARGPLAGPGALFAGQWAEWLSTWVWIPGWILIITLLLLLFPDGHPPSRRWRPAIWATFASIGLMMLGTSWFDPNPRSQPGYRNPLPIATEATKGLSDLLKLAGLLLGLVAAVACLVALLVRFRRSRGGVRLQLKWFAYAGVATLVLLPGNTTLATTPVLEVMGYLSIPLLPVAVGVAVLKHRLYDIDLVINKTVVYGALAAFISGVYVVVVVGIGSLVGSASRPNVPLSIAATAVVAVAFQPVRARVQRLANRLVYGERATPYEVLSEFSERMAGAYAAEELLPRMARTLAEGTGSSRAEVWLRVGDELVLDAAWPEEAGPRRRVPVQGDRLAMPGDVTRAVEVRHDGDMLGALAVVKRPGEPLSSTEERLLGDLASQAGLVLRNVGLTEELLARLDELRASRQRLVAAQDEERRRLERNIHDGAQQQLEALAEKIRLVESLIDRVVHRAGSMLDDVRAEARDALEPLRDLARGIYPPVLAERGLAAALEAQTRHSAVPVEIRVPGTGRYPVEVEAAVYFSVLEALQNVAKYAAASRAWVDVSNGEGRLEFRVRDDGKGFDVASVPRGAGLQNMADRLAALEGTIQIESAPGHGATVIGRIPVRSQPTS